MKPSSFLSQIKDKKHEEIRVLYEHKGLPYFVKKVAALSDSFSAMEEPGVFYNALNQSGLSLIAELKKASPSKGVIYDDFNPVSLAQDFSSKGASALSILTEKHYFKGNPNYISLVKQTVSLPVLRKDFIFDPIQVYESKLLQADAILLIMALLEDSQCQELLRLATQIGLDVLLEVHNEDELSRALTLEGLTILGINNRDLHTFNVDLNTASRLYNMIKTSGRHDCLVVAESGYQSISDLTSLKEQGFSAVLIGEGLAKQEGLMDFYEN